jgi:hypothetical protein
MRELALTLLEVQTGMIRQKDERVMMRLFAAARDTGLTKRASMLWVRSSKLFFLLAFELFQ